MDRDRDNSVMGNQLCGGSHATKEQLAAIEDLNKNKDITNELRKDKEKEKAIIKLLLLGTGESGKSTIFKQMQILYDQGFTDIDKNVFRGVLRSNVVEAMQTLIAGMELLPFFDQEKGLQPTQLTWEDGTSQHSAQYIEQMEYLNTDFWEHEIVDHVKQLWKEPVIQKVYANRARLQLLDSSRYLFREIERIGADEYIPNTKDILMARLRTSGIVERLFNVHGVKFRFLDVGGQRNERKKWLHCFDRVTSVVFVAAISEFDQFLFEEEDVNRLRESINVFGMIANEECFKDTAMILFLNKIDLFREKLETTNVKDYLEDFEGNNTYEEASEHIQTMFLDAVQNSEKMVFCHFTQATDTDHFDKVFDACKLVILRGNLEKLGLE